METLANNGQPHHAGGKPMVPRKRSRSLYRMKSIGERLQLRQSVEAEKRSAILKAASQKRRSGMMISCCRPSCTIGSSLNVSEFSAASPICISRHPDWIRNSTTLEVGRKRPASKDGLVNGKVKVVCPSEVVVNLVLRRSVDSNQSVRLRESSREAVAGKDGYPADKRRKHFVRQSKLHCKFYNMLDLLVWGDLLIYSGLHFKQACLYLFMYLCI